MVQLVDYLFQNSGESWCKDLKKIPLAEHLLPEYVYNEMIMKIVMLQEYFEGLLEDINIKVETPGTLKKEYGNLCWLPVFEPRQVEMGLIVKQRHRR